MDIDNNVASHKPVIHGGIFSIKHPQPDILDFSSNISPIGPPTDVKKSITKNINKIQIYPDSDSDQLRKKIGKALKVPLDCVTVGNGATEIIYNFCFAFSKKPNVLIPIPTFGEYEAASKLYGCKVSFFKTMDLNVNLSDFIRKIPKNGCVFLCNPNNPTGTLLTKKSILQILKQAKRKLSLLFVDECFMELVPDKQESVIDFVKSYDNLFVLRSLTKSYGLAGIRIGYGIANKKLISIINKIKIPWNVNGLAQQAASSVLSNSGYLKRANNIIRKESNFLRNQILNIPGFECSPSTTNFILLKTKLKSNLVQKKLLNKKILVRDCSSFRGLNDHYIRIAVKTRKENKILIKELRNLK